jgi:type II secretory pathway pseudopilin PulG
MATPQAPSAPAIVAPAGNNGVALAAMVMGIVGLCMCWFPLIGWILSGLAIVFGAIGMSRAGKLGRRRGQAIAGLVCGIVGVLLGGMMAAVAIPAFVDYMHKAKRTASSLELNMISHRIKGYYAEHSDLPPSSVASLPGPDGAACADPTHKMPVSQGWASDPAWGAMEFSVDEPSYYTFHWTRTSATSGYATAVCDLDCDAQMSTTRLDVTVVSGNVQTTRGAPSPD